MDENKILILDIETTGFLPQGGSIVEIGIVELNLDTGEIIEIFQSLLREKILNWDHGKPPYGWIFKNSDLTLEELRTAPNAYIIFSQVQEILNSYPIGCTAYNNKFDFGFLIDRGLKIKILPCPMILSTDICKIPSRDSRSQYKWPSVEEAFKFFFPDSEYIEKHRGLDDAKHEAMIVYRLYQDGIFKINQEVKP